MLRARSPPADERRAFTYPSHHETVAAVKTSLLTAGAGEGGKPLGIVVAAADTDGLLSFVINSFTISNIAIFIMGLDDFHRVRDVIKEQLLASEKLLEVLAVGEVRAKNGLGDIWEL